MAWIKGFINSAGEVEIDRVIKFTGRVNTKTISLTNAEIKALRATNKELVAAPGAGKFLELVSGRIFLDYGANVLTEAADNLAVNYGGAAGVVASQVVECTGFIDQAADMWTCILPKVDQIATTAQLVNQALTLDNNGAAEFAGNAGLDTVLKVYITYRVHSV